MPAAHLIGENGTALKRDLLMAACSFVDYRLQEQGVAVLTLDNPPLNLTTLVTLDKLIGACREIAGDEKVRAVVVVGAGEKAFCAGSDIGEFAHVRHDVVGRKLARENAAFAALEQLPMPVIAALNGVALGGGAEIALACDIRIMDETARIGFPEVKLGIFPGSGGIFRLPRLVGPATAYELLYTGELIDAREAHRIGLVNRLAPAGQALSAALAFARTLASRPALALSLIRAGVRDSLHQTTRQAIDRTLADSHRAFTGPDIEEGIDRSSRPDAPRSREEMMINRRTLLRTIASAAAGIAAPHVARAQEVKHYRFAYDQPKPTGYGILGDIFADKLKALSKGTMLIDQYPGAQLGQEPQVLQLVKSGDIEFCISSSANAATVSPQAGVMSLHYLFRSEDHLIKAMGDPRLSEACKAMISDTVEGARIIALSTLGLRNMYSKREIRKIEDIKGLKVRVQATPTEDTMFPAYGAQTVHMPFGSVYTSLQTGVIDVAENGVNVYLANKHYEVAPVLSMTEHEANNSFTWVSDKLWNSFSSEQKGWVQAAADEVNRNQPAKAIALEHESATKLKSIGVKIVSEVDKSGFQKIADPYLDKMSAELGPHASKIKDLIRGIS